MNLAKGVKIFVEYCCPVTSFKKVCWKLNSVKDYDVTPNLEFYKNCYFEFKVGRWSIILVKSHL